MQPLSQPDPVSSVSAPVKIRPRRLVRLASTALTLLTLGVAVSIAKEQTPLVPAASWNAATPHPVGVTQYGFAQNGEDFYVISGISGGTTAAMRRYNATTNVWTSLADIPVGSQTPTAVFFGGKIYVGDGSTGAPSVFRIYDIATNTWSEGPPRIGLTSCFGAAAGAFNGNVYFAGGGFAAGGSSVLSIYNIASNTWSVGPAAPAPYRQGGFAQIGQFLYVIGSYGVGPDNGALSMRLDMATNTWSTGPTWTPQRADFALVAAGPRLFAIGGDTNGGDGFDPSVEVDELDTSIWPAGAWVPSPDNLPSPRQGNRAGFFSTGRAGGEIWSTGGSGPSFSLTEHLFRPVSVPCQDYNVATSTRSIVPASTDTGNHCNDCVTPITLPFPIRFYGTTYTSGNVSSNGNLQFNSANISPTNTNLPAAGFNATIFAFWDDLRTTAAGNGIFTSVTGTAPNRVFTIEWRASHNSSGGTANFEIRFLEGSPDFEILYGATTGSFTASIGVQRDANSLSTYYTGPTANPPAAGTRLLFTTGCCAPIAFNGAIGSNSITYPGSSGFQQGRLNRNGVRSACGTAKPFPGTLDTTQRTADVYSFNNAGPAACVTFSVNTACTGAAEVFPVAYLGSYNSGNIAANYLGDPGLSPVPFQNFSVDVPANSTVLLVVHEVQPQGSCNSYDVVVTGLNCPLELTTAVSRKTHGAAGEFDIPLPLTGQPGVESRNSGGNHKLVFTFDSELTSGNAAVTTGIGSAGSPTFLGTTMSVPLSGVTDLQKIAVTLSNVTNTVGQVLPNTAVSMNVLLGDTTGNKSVNASDIAQTKTQSGLPVSAANFRTDTTVSGSINASDISQVKANSGHFVP